MCAPEILVISPASGLTISVRKAISPGWLAPISNKPACVSPFISRILSGTPMWLLRFPFVAVTRKRVASTAWINSLVVVFPLDPVRAITGMLKVLRWVTERCCKAAKTSGTLIKRGSSTEQLSTTAYAAPLPSASRAKRFPSKRSP